LHTGLILAYKARYPGTQKEGDDEGNAGEEEKETSVKARARSGRSVAAALGGFRRQDQRSIVPSPPRSADLLTKLGACPSELMWIDTGHAVIDAAIDAAAFFVAAGDAAYRYI
jgi:hypothetical protein